MAKNTGYLEDKRKGYNITRETVGRQIMEDLGTQAK